MAQQYLLPLLVAHYVMLVQPLLYLVLDHGHGLVMAQGAAQTLVAQPAKLLPADPQDTQSFYQGDLMVKLVEAGAFRQEGN
tara:strand:- start:35 stop:277 length:243 start_codon:yes stop_codon:yes gene_type:complete